MPGAAIPTTLTTTRSRRKRSPPGLLRVGRPPHAPDLIGFCRRLAALELVDHVHAVHDLADHGVLLVQKEAVVEHDEELAVGGIVAVALARHADDAALERPLGELGLEVGMLRAAGAVAVLAVAGLRHEAVDDTMKRHVVVKTVARQPFEALGV